MNDIMFEILADLRHSIPHKSDKSKYLKAAGENINEVSREIKTLTKLHYISDFDGISITEGGIIAYETEAERRETIRQAKTSARISIAISILALIVSILSFLVGDANIIEKITNLACQLV